MTVIETENLEKLSLDNCDKEPVHIPGHIQGFAVCLSTDKDLNLVQLCSDNAQSVFGMDVVKSLARTWLKYSTKPLFMI